MNREKGQRYFQTRSQSLNRWKTSRNRVLAQVNEWRVQRRVAGIERSRGNHRWKGRRMGRWRAKSFERGLSNTGWDVWIGKKRSKRVERRTGLLLLVVYVYIFVCCVCRRKREIKELTAESDGRW